MEYHYDHLLETLILLTVHNRCPHINALFLINIFSGTKCCSSVLETVGLRVPTRNMHNFNMFTCPSSHCPSARCVSTANAVGTFTDVFRNSCSRVKSLTGPFFFVFVTSFVIFCFVLCCHIASVIIRADSVIGHRLLSSARK
jgi:hypothetical protein